MELADLVLYKDQRWVVVSLDRTCRLMALYNKLGDRVELPNDYDLTHATELQVICNPPKSWKLLPAKVRNVSAGPFVNLGIAGSPLVLQPWVEWLPSSYNRSGGPVYIRPDVKLKPGMTLIATHQSGLQVSVIVPRSFVTVERRVKLDKQKQRAAGKVVEEKEEVLVEEGPAVEPIPNRYANFLRDDDD